jgi:hypothetical protein
MLWVGDHLENLGVDNDIIVKRFINKCLGAWTGIVRLKTGTDGELLWMWLWIFHFHNKSAISWLAEDLLDFQEELCSMVLIFQLGS